MRLTLVQALLIGGGGFLGALLRFGLGGLLHGRFPKASFPIGTLAVNLLGCLLIGVLAGMVQVRQLFGPEFRHFAMVGLLGGFTTFSTFGFETFAMMRDGEPVHAFLNVALHLVPGLVLVWLGFSLATAR